MLGPPSPLVYHKSNERKNNSSQNLVVLDASLSQNLIVLDTSYHKILYILMGSLHIFLYSDIRKVYFLAIKSYGKVLSD